MIEKDIPRKTTTTIFADDLLRLSRLKRPRTNKRPFEPSLESCAHVVRRALDALEALEKTRISQ